jgi:hypothetical protein
MIMTERSERPVEQGRASASLAECTVTGPEETPPRYQVVAGAGEYDPEEVPDLPERNSSNCTAGWSSSR